MKRILIALVALVVIAGSVAANAKDETRILKAPPPAADDHTCSVQLNKQSIQCDLALYIQGGNRVRVQFNNDDFLGAWLSSKGRSRRTTRSSLTISRWELL